MATYYRTGVETYSIIGAADEKDSLEGRIPDGSTYFAVDENMFYTFYDGTWYETLPEAARLYHDDVGTDTKPIKLVGGVATVVANELAEDSKVVHNTGDETVAGEKTFTGKVIMDGRNPEIHLHSNIGENAQGWKGVIRYTDNGSESKPIFTQRVAARTTSRTLVENIVYCTDRTTSKTFSLDCRDTYMLVHYPPYYPVDESSNPQALDTDVVMTSGNIAVDPRIVHTTGNEDIAGNKTFSTKAVINRLERGYTLTVTKADEWLKLYEFTPATYGTNVHFSIVNDYNIQQFVGAEIRINIGNSPGFNLNGKMFGVGSAINCKVAKRTNDTIEVWVQNAAGATMDISTEIVHQRSTTPKPIGQIGTMPVVGDTYTAVVDITAIS